MAETEQLPPIAIGIDLGTTYCCVCYIDNTEKYIYFEYDKSIVPSCVSIVSDSIEIGLPAYEKRGIHPSQTIHQFKRFMGKKAQDPELAGKVFEFQVVEDAKGMAKFQIGENNELYPEEVLVIMLDYLKAHAQEVSQRVVSQAVITVPANFDNAQREATLAAAKIAGLDVLRILNEPTAAALAYAYENRKNGRTELKKRTVLVYDLGGGTFDVSVVIIEGQTEKVVVTLGEQWLGGEDFDNIIYEAILPQVQETKRDLTPKDDWDIKLAAMEIKIELSRSVVARKTLSLQGGFTLEQTQIDE